MKNPLLHPGGKQASGYVSFSPRTIPPVKSKATEYCWVYHPSYGFFFIQGTESYHFRFFKGEGKGNSRTEVIPGKLYDDCNRGYAFVDRDDRTISVQYSAALSSSHLGFVPSQVVQGFKEAFPGYKVENSSSHYSSRKQALDAVLEELNRPEAANDPRASEEEFSPLYGKGTEVNNDMRALACGGTGRKKQGSTVSDLTEEVTPVSRVLGTPNVADATFFKESEEEFEASRTASGFNICRVSRKVADTQSYGAGTPIGGTPNNKSQADTSVPNPTTPATPAGGAGTVTQQQVTQQNVKPPTTPAPVTGQPAAQQPVAAPGAPVVPGAPVAPGQVIPGAPVIPGQPLPRQPLVAAQSHIEHTPSPEFMPPQDRNHKSEEVLSDQQNDPDLHVSSEEKVAWIEDDDDDDDDDDNSGEYGTLYGKPLGGNREPRNDVNSRLEYLRDELRAECISTEELMELQDLAGYIDPDDVELLEAAGVEEKQPLKPKRYRTTKDDEDFLKSIGVKAKKAAAELATLGEEIDTLYSLTDGKKIPQKDADVVLRLASRLVEEFERKEASIKTATKTEENLTQTCPNCHSSNYQKIEDAMEDGALAECSDCGCFFAL